jgi:transposase-like protein
LHRQVGGYLKACAANVSRLEASVPAVNGAVNGGANVTAVAHRHGVVRAAQQLFSADARQTEVFGTRSKHHVVNAQLCAEATKCCGVRSRALTLVTIHACLLRFDMQ